MAKKIIYEKENTEYLNHCCRECRLCQPVMDFNTLTVKDKKPTLGRCPREEYCVLLSQRACKNYNKKDEAIP